MHMDLVSSQTSLEWKHQNSRTQIDQKLKKLNEYLSIENFHNHYEPIPVINMG